MYHQRVVFFETWFRLDPSSIHGYNRSQLTTQDSAISICLWVVDLNKLNESDIDVSQPPKLKKIKAKHSTRYFVLK